MIRKALVMFAVLALISKLDGRPVAWLNNHAVAPLTRIFSDEDCDHQPLVRLADAPVENPGTNGDPGSVGAPSVEEPKHESVQPQVDEETLLLRRLNRLRSWSVDANPEEKK